jgi:hypothetical protein
MTWGHGMPTYFEQVVPELVVGGGEVGLPGPQPDHRGAAGHQVLDPSTVGIAGDMQQVPVGGTRGGEGQNMNFLHVNDGSMRAETLV